VVASLVLERATRWMPLPGDSSLLGGGKGQLPMHLASLVRPAVEALCADPLSEALMAEAIAAVMLLGERAKVLPVPLPPLPYSMCSCCSRREKSDEGFGAGRQKIAAERGTTPRLSRRACCPQCGLQMAFSISHI
jgi:hypothetical protein